MTFTERKNFVAETEEMIQKYLKDNKLKFVEDITNRDVKDRMIASNYIKKSICGSESSETQEYWYQKALNYL